MARSSGLGVSNETGLPSEWSPEKNVLWKTEIPGRGHSSPIVSGNRIFVTTSVRGVQVPGKKAPVHLDFNHQPGYVHPDSTDVDYKHTLKVYAIDAPSGKIVWERTAYDGEMWDDRHRKNTYASSTMATDGKQVYAFFESPGLYAYDFDGKLLWKSDLGGIIKAGLGPGTSPVLFENLVILQRSEMGAGRPSSRRSPEPAKTWRGAKELAKQHAARIEGTIAGARRAWGRR
jgi:outer membrane protein assembly factor BamB